jgi:hypothetical protein
MSSYLSVRLVRPLLRLSSMLGVLDESHQSNAVGPCSSSCPLCLNVAQVGVLSEEVGPATLSGALSSCSLGTPLRRYVPNTAPLARSPRAESRLHSGTSYAIHSPSGKVFSPKSVCRKLHRETRAEPIMPLSPGLTDGVDHNTLCGRIRRRCREYRRDLTQLV